MKAPFRLFDPDSAYASGMEEAGYFDARILYGEERVREDGTIATLAEAIKLRQEITDLYEIDVERIEIRDAEGKAVRGEMVSSTTYFYRPIYAGVLKCAGLADETNRAWMMSEPGTIELIGFRGEKILADTHQEFKGLPRDLINNGVEA